MQVRPRHLDTAVAALLVTGAAGFAAYVLPRTGTAISPALANGGTFVGAVCFFAGAWLVIPAFRPQPAVVGRSHPWPRSSPVRGYRLRPRAKPALTASNTRPTANESPML